MVGDHAAEIAAHCRVGSSVRENIPAQHGHIRVTVAATGNDLKACDLSLLHGVRNSSDPYLVFSQEGSELGRNVLELCRESGISSR